MEKRLLFSSAKLNSKLVLGRSGAGEPASFLSDLEGLFPISIRSREGAQRRDPRFLVMVKGELYFTEVGCRGKAKDNYTV